MPDVFVSQPVDKTNKKEEKKPSKNTLSSPGENHFHALASFCENPNGLTFRSQGPNETILLFARRHFITNVPWIFATVILFVLPVVIMIMIANNLITPPPLSAQQTTLGLLLYTVVVFGYAFINFISWFYNIFIVTQTEVVDVDFSNIVYHDVAATNLNLAEDVNYTQSGFIRSLFNYGDVFVQTAGGKENIEAIAIPSPQRAAQIILNLIGKGQGE